MKKLLCAAVAALIASAALVGFAATPASAEPSGQYVTYCTGPDGRTFEWHAPDYQCNGWIDRYINGNRVAHVKETRPYAAWRNDGRQPAISVDCSVAGGLFILTLLAEPVGWVGLAAGLLGTGFACRHG